MQTISSRSIAQGPSSLTLLMSSGLQDFSIIFASTRPDNWPMSAKSKRRGRKFHRLENGSECAVCFMSGRGRLGLPPSSAPRRPLPRLFMGDSMLLCAESAEKEGL